MYDINEEIRREGLLEEYRARVNDLEKSVKEIKKRRTAVTSINFISAVIKYDEIDKTVHELVLNRGPGGDKDPFIECSNYVVELLCS